MNDETCFACREGQTDYVDVLGMTWHWLCFLDFDSQHWLEEE